MELAPTMEIAHVLKLICMEKNTPTGVLLYQWQGPNAQEKPSTAIAKIGKASALFALLLPTPN